jgi:hypothetical protein
LFWHTHCPFESTSFDPHVIVAFVRIAEHLCPSNIVPAWQLMHCPDTKLNPELQQHIAPFHFAFNPQFIPIA